VDALTPPPRLSAGMDEFHESGRVASIPGVRDEEWDVPGLLRSRAGCKRTTFFRGPIPIQLKTKTKWNGPFRASFRANRTRPKSYINIEIRAIFREGVLEQFSCLYTSSMYMHN
jgi:hypothetical protein